MPGTTVWLPGERDATTSGRGGESSVLADRDPSRFAEGLEELKHDSDYDREIVVDEERLKIGVTRYPGYPVRTVEDDEYLVCLEGKRYGEDLSRDDLLTLGEKSIRKRREWLEEWIGSSDGDFVVFALEKDTGTLAVVNDAFGRLPLYAYERGEEVILTRENKFIRTFLNDVDVDSVGVAQCLLFGFTLGSRTVWENVDKLDGGSLVRYEPGSGLERERVHRFDFGRRKDESRTIAENAATLATSFERACKRRADEASSTVVSLSGGHDSRSVAAGYRANGSPFVAATFARPSAADSIGTGADVEIAEKTANALGVDWHRVDLGPTVPEDFRLLLSLKGGMNPFTNANTVEFFRCLREEFGSGITYVTGDGGDKAVPDLSPPRDLADVDELVSYLLDAESIVFPLERVIALTGVSEAELRETVTSRVRSYPESDPGDMYVGYKVRERGFNWLNEGEDRNRAFFWSTSPFYSLPFFREAMAVPPEQKAHNRLYRAFLEQLWPEATQIDHANFRVSMASPVYPAVQRVLSVLAAHPRIEDAVRPLYRRELFSEYDENLARLLLAQLRECDGVGDVFVEGELARIGADRSSCNSQQAHNLLTMTSAVADVTCGDPSFEVVEGMEFT